MRCGCGCGRGCGCGWRRTIYETLDSYNFYFPLQMRFRCFCPYHRYVWMDFCMPGLPCVFRKKSQQQQLELVHLHSTRMHLKNKNKKRRESFSISGRGKQLPTKLASNNFISQDPPPLSLFVCGPYSNFIAIEIYVSHKDLDIVSLLFFDSKKAYFDFNTYTDTFTHRYIYVDIDTLTFKFYRNG